MKSRFTKEENGQQERFYLRRLQGDLHTHGAADAWKLAGQRLLGFMSHLWDVFDGQIKLEEMIIIRTIFTSEHLKTNNMSQLHMLYSQL